MFDRQRVLTNRRSQGATVDQSRVRWAGLVSTRASEEEEEFLAAILDVRTDCLRKWRRPRTETVTRNSPVKEGMKTSS
ncbi:unnamed protein product [Pleuronectes platessa]|uniref:Uncharacterized protein n=1 Tax=Pleuronectes platessa TaxID=8262 RepID=A0A9N7TL93_PLEPL|nr:unnamed protein product [Pleuronectes platessa]